VAILSLEVGTACGRAQDSPSLASAQARAAAEQAARERRLQPATTVGDSEQQRESWQRVDDVFKELGVFEGASVADIGFGRGFFSVRLARAVGPRGSIVAVEIKQPLIDALAMRAKTESLPNIHVIKGDGDNPHLSPASLDAILVCDAYHEMSDQRSMLERMKESLKPGGRLVIVDQHSAAADHEPRALQQQHHSMRMEWAIQDLKAAGFDVVQTIPEFIHRPSANGGPGDQTQWLIRATPASSM